MASRWARLMERLWVQCLVQPLEGQSGTKSVLLLAAQKEQR